MKGVPDHGAGASPAPTSQAKGGSKVWFEAYGWVRRSTAVPLWPAVLYESCSLGFLFAPWALFRGPFFFFL